MFEASYEMQGYPSALHRFVPGYARCDRYEVRRCDRIGLTMVESRISGVRTAEELSKEKFTTALWIV